MIIPVSFYIFSHYTTVAGGGRPPNIFSLMGISRAPLGLCGVVFAGASVTAPYQPNDTAVEAAILT